MSAPAAAIPAASQPAPFGTAFAPIMTVIYYHNGRWSAIEQQSVAPLALHPASHALHYGSACFEGLKAYRWANGETRLFRVDRHAERLRQSAKLLCLPCPERAALIDAMSQAVAANSEAVPPPPGALYLRPTLIGTDANIGAAGAPSNDALLFVLCSPVGDYFAGGRQRPLRILIETQGMRAVPGFGQAKTGGNYAAALRHVMRARRDAQADQVLFCPGGDVQETGASNFLLISNETIITKPLDSTFLHGVTRDSILRLGEHLGYTISERDFTVDELLHWVDDGFEAALSGTAAVLASVGTLIDGDNGREIAVSGGEVGPNTRRLRQALTDIQTGHATDHFAWTQAVS